MTRKEKQTAETDYAIVVERLDEADGGGWLASVPALPGCFGDGETRAEALADALAAIEEWKDAARQLGREVPGPASPGQWRQRVPRTLHDKLRRLAAADGVSLNQLVTTLLAEAVGRRSVTG
jgi:antitoxin HicB